MRTGPALPSVARDLFVEDATRLSSTKEFKLPQSGQRPSHLAAAYPHAWHSNSHCCLDMSLLPCRNQQAEGSKHSPSAVRLPPSGLRLPLSAFRLLLYRCVG